MFLSYAVLAIPFVKSHAKVKWNLQHIVLKVWSCSWFRTLFFLLSGPTSVLFLPKAQSHLPSEQAFQPAYLTALIFHSEALVLGWTVISETIPDAGCQVSSLPFLGWDEAILTSFLWATLILWAFKTSNVVLPYGGNRDDLVVHFFSPFYKGTSWW